MALWPRFSGTTVWRWLSDDAIKPWRHRSWIFPRDPDFEAKASRVLDLYALEWKGKALGEDDYVLSADEKTSIQARARRHPSLAPAPGRDARVEHEYGRAGALQYFAAWDVHRAKILWPLRGKDRHRALRPSRWAGDGLRALPLGTAGFLGGRQRFQPPR